jgi:hypothetical protein
MWLFLYTCYALITVTGVLFTAAVVQGFAGIPVLGAGHPAFGFFTTIVFLLTQTAVIFFFVATGVSVRDFVRERGLGPDLLQRSRRAHGPVSGQATLSLLLIMGTAISGGASAAAAIPRWMHLAVVALTYAHFLMLVVMQHRAFRTQTAIVVEMAELARDSETEDGDDDDGAGAEQQ